MPQCVIIADDLTGANATGVLMTKLDFKTYTVTNQERLDLSNLSNCDCVTYPTDSRSVDSKIAYNRVYNVASILKCPDVKLYSKRIDSTLRGNLGSETDALLDAFGNDTVAMAVPCFPSSNRILVGGYLLVNSIPLHNTEAAVDPKNPIHTSIAARLFRQQSKYPVDCVYIEDLAQGEKHMVRKIRELKQAGVRTIIFDSVTQEDIDLVANSVIASGVKFVAVDPGVFTSTLARKIITPKQLSKKQRILVSVGSVNAVARNQVKQFLLSQKVRNVYINIRELLEGERRRESEISRVVREILDGCEDFEICSIVGGGILPENRVSFEPYMESLCCSSDVLSNSINEAIAEMVRRILSSNNGFQGLYSCGGDITVAICRNFHTVGIKLLDEVLPLAAYGELIGGDFEGLRIITKGGMVGDENAIVTCTRYLKEKMFI